MGQDTHCITGASAPVKFTFKNWAIFRNILFNPDNKPEITVENGLYVIMLTEPDTGLDECRDITDYLGEYMIDSPLTSTEFDACVTNLTVELRRRKRLPLDKSLADMEIYVMAGIMDSHIRNLSRRDNPHIFYMEEVYKPKNMISAINASVKVLTAAGIRESEIFVNSYVWDSQ